MPSDSTWRFKKTLLQKWLLVRKLKQSITESSKTNQYDLDRQTTKVSALSSGNVSKYEFVTDKDFLPENDLLEKAATQKWFEYSPLRKELKAQTVIAKDQFKSFKDQMNINNNNMEEDMSDKDKSDETVKDYWKDY